MNLLFRLVEGFLDFLFPKSITTLELEALTAAEMLYKFPPPKKLGDENTVALFDYSDESVRNLVWEIKYKANPALINKVGELMYEILSTELADRFLYENFSDTILIPIPMSTSRLKHRGFNQTKLICESIMRFDQGNLLSYSPNALKRQRNSESQTKTHSRKEREENIYGSMVGGQDYLKSKCVILIDDVITTGSTMREAKRALKEIGAKKFLCLSIAH